MRHVSVRVVQHLTWHLASHKNNMVMFNSAYKVWSYLFEKKIVDWDVKPQLKQTKTKLHNIHVQSY